MSALRASKAPAAPRILLVALAAALLSGSGCLHIRKPATPVVTQRIDVPGAPSRASAGPDSPAPCLVLFLPGRRDALGAYRRRDFAGTAVRAGVSAEFVEVDMHLGYYQAETVARRLHEDVVAPARGRGVKKIWIAGLSMGGLGGMLYAKEHPDLVRGVIALAPYLGDTEPANVAAAGGLARWKPGAPREIADYERQLWAWLKRFSGAPSSSGAAIPTELYLGYGLSDELAPADKLLADVLHPDRVFTARGGHDWGTWTNLWRQILAAGVLQRDCGPEKGKEGSTP